MEGHRQKGHESLEDERGTPRVRWTDTVRRDMKAWKMREEHPG